MKLQPEEPKNLEETKQTRTCLQATGQMHLQLRIKQPLLEETQQLRV